MTREEIQHEVISVLRLCALSGSTREIQLTAPLGDQGLGLDSLALVEFVAALEGRFTIEIPDTIWTDRGEMSPEDFADLIFELQPQTLSTITGGKYEHRPADAANVSYIHKAGSEIRRRGIFFGLLWVLNHGFAQLIEYIYAKERHIILVRDLSKNILVENLQVQNIVFKELVLTDSAALQGLWPPHRQSKMMRYFRKRLQSGFLCFSAWKEGEVVGIDYLSGTGDRDPETGLTITLLPGTCYAIDLYEKYHGQGIGLALLGFSLQEAQRRGFLRQVTFVRKNNDKMLAASIQLHGFKKIGEIVTTRVFKRPSSKWTLSSLSGNNAIIHLIVLIFLQSCFHFFESFPM